eukprot:2539985-Pyramimonas_sp.AAC.1
MCVSLREWADFFRLGTLLDTRLGGPGGGLVGASSAIQDASWPVFGPTWAPWSARWAPQAHYEASKRVPTRCSKVVHDLSVVLHIFDASWSALGTVFGAL